MFSYEFSEISKSTSFTEHLWVTASIKKILLKKHTCCNNGAFSIIQRYVLVACFIISLDFFISKKCNMLGKKKYAAYTCRSYYIILMHLDAHIFLHNCIMIISQLPQQCKNVKIFTKLSLDYLSGSIIFFRTRKLLIKLLFQIQ